MKTIKKILVSLFVLSVFSASAQKFGATEQDSIDCIRNLSLYTEFFKQRSYDDAFEPWLQVYKLCPANHVNTYIRGNTLVKMKISKEKDPAKRQEYIDLLLEVWDARSQYFGNEGVNTSRKAMDLIAYRPKEIDQAYKMMYKAVVELGVGDDYIAPFFLFEYAMQNEKAGNIDKEQVFEIYDITSSYLEKILKSKPKDTNVLNTLSNLDIAFEPYASCDDIIPIFEKKWEANKGDVVFLEKITKVLDHKNCNESELFFKATEALHALKPDPKTAYLMAKMLAGKKNYGGVIDYLKEDATKLENERDQVRALLLLAEAYKQENRYREGREAALKALEINPKEGMVYIVIGMMYAQSARDCGDEAAVSQRAAYWAAVDKFRKAKEIDPNRAEQADALISAYSQQFPAKNDLFFLGIQEGTSYRVGCWIQENTIVRSR